MAVICFSGIERDIVVDDLNSRIERMERQLGMITRTTPTSAGGSMAFSIPPGVIVMWAGAIANIPEGWALADGTNGTPDLRNSFIVAAGDTYSVDDTGGADANDLSHTHGTGTLVMDNDTHDHAVNAGVTGSGGGHTHGPGSLDTDSTGSHRHSVGTYSTGTESASENVEAGATEAVPATSHIHQVTGQSAYAGSHDHSVNAGVTGSGGSHTHGSGSLDTDNDTHNHTVSGSTASAGSAAQENRPVYYSLAFIMKVAD